MLEWLIRKHCEREGLGWPPALTRVDGAEPATAAAAAAKSKAKPAKSPTSKSASAGRAV
jgi:hypothetical protein